MKKMLLLAGVATTMFAINANALEWNPYISGKLGFSKIDTDYKWTDSAGGESYSQDDTIAGISIAAGLSMPVVFGAVRTELEYRQNDDAEDKIANLIETSVETQSLMLNAYVDFDTGTKLTPYIGGGIGYAKVEGTMKEPLYGNEASMDDNNFAWQLGVGASYNITKNMAVDAGYRYIDFGDFSETSADEKDTLDVTANEFYIGARYTF